MFLSSKAANVYNNKRDNAKTANNFLDKQEDCFFKQKSYVITMKKLSFCIDIIIIIHIEISLYGQSYENNL